MDNLDKEIIIEKFIDKVGYDLSEVERLVSFLRIDDEKQQKILDEAIKVYKAKLKKIKKSKSIEDLNKHLKVKKVVKNYDPENHF